MKTVRATGAPTRASVAMLSIACVALFFGCPKAPSGTSGSGAASTSAHVDEKEHPTIPRRIHLDESVVTASKIRTEPARMEPFSAVLSLPGEIATNPDRTARVSSPIAGRLDRVDFREGATVKKGDVLALVRIPELGKLKSAYAEALARARAAKVTAAREEELFAAHATSERSYLDAKTNAETTQAMATGLGEQLAALGAGSSSNPALLALRSPLDGVVVARNAIVGQPISAEQSIGTIVDLSEAWFLARVFEKDLGQLHAGARADVVLNAFPHEAFDGSVEYVGREVDPVARTLTARIVLTNRDDLLRIGLFGTARVSTNESVAQPAVLVVPRSALTQLGNASVVFVREPDGDFELHEVVTGQAALGKLEIISGLRAGENVVVDGVFTLKSVALKSSLADED